MLGRHLVGIKNLDRKDIEYVLDLAEDMEPLARRRKPCDLLSGCVLVTLFYEPSTRTRLSFETAMLRLGGGVVSMADAARTSSAWKGETLADTIRVVDSYGDAIVIRHPQVGAAAEAARYSRVPILNAGDGTNEHPTQTLLDLLTIRRECGALQGLRVAILGDLKHTRAAHSLAYALANFDVEIVFVSPEELRMTEEVKGYVRERGHAVFTETSDVKAAVEDADVMYICRIQKERLERPEDYERYKDSYVVDRSTFDRARKVVRVLHHLPRVGELKEDVDDYPGACYFKQPFNGVLARMALLCIYLERLP